jgi:hypothetical protein
VPQGVSKNAGARFGSASRYDHQHLLQIRPERTRVPNPRTRIHFSSGIENNQGGWQVRQKNQISSGNSISLSCWLRPHGLLNRTSTRQGNGGSLPEVNIDL